MILVDTSVWIEFFLRGNEDLETLLDDGQVLMHPCILGELACGYLEPRDRILQDLAAMKQMGKARDDEVLYFIEQHQLMGSGIGYLDAHLLASVRLNEGVRLWTLDKKLAKAAEQLLPIY